MAYRNVNEDPDFPPMAAAPAGVINPHDPSASSLTRATYPYRRHADRYTGPRIVLRPPACDPESADPVAAAIAQLQDTMQQVARSNRLISAPWILPPPDAQSFHKPDGQNLPAISPTAFTAIVSITVPAGQNGVLNRIANEFVGGGFTDFSGSIIWQLTRNTASGISAVEPNFENITASLGSVANPAAIAGIRIFENDVVTLQINNNAVPVASQLVGGLLGGWFYPKSWDDQFDAADASMSW